MSCVDFVTWEKTVRWRFPHDGGGGGGGGLPFLCCMSLEMPALSSDETQRLLAGLRAVLQVLPLRPLISLCFYHKKWQP